MKEWVLILVRFEIPLGTTTKLFLSFHQVSAASECSAYLAHFGDWPILSPATLANLACLKTEVHRRQILHKVKEEHRPFQRGLLAHFLDCTGNGYLSLPSCIMPMAGENLARSRKCPKLHRCFLPVHSSWLPASGLIMLLCPHPGPFLQHLKNES